MGPCGKWEGSQAWAELPRDVICHHFTAFPGLRLVNRHWSDAISSQLHSIVIRGPLRDHCCEQLRQRLSNVREVVVKCKEFDDEEALMVCDLWKCLALLNLSRTMVRSV